MKLRRYGMDNWMRSWGNIGDGDLELGGVIFWGFIGSFINIWYDWVEFIFCGC